MHSYQALGKVVYSIEVSGQEGLCGSSNGDATAASTVYIVETANPTLTAVDLLASEYEVSPQYLESLFQFLLEQLIILHENQVALGGLEEQNICYFESEKQWKFADCRNAAVVVDQDKQAWLGKLQFRQGNQVHDKFSQQIAQRRTRPSWKEVQKFDIDCLAHIFRSLGKRYGQSALIEEAVDCILSQTTPDSERPLVDMVRGILLRGSLLEQGLQS